MNFHLKILLLSCLIIGGVPRWADDVPVAPISLTQLADWGNIYEISTRKVSIIVSPETGSVVSMRNSGGAELLLSPLLIQAIPLPFEETPWESRAWRTSVGKQVVMLYRNLGEPYNLRVVHVIELSASGDHFRQTTRMTGLAPEAQRFLDPSIETTLPRPDSKVQKEKGDAELIYGQTINKWEFHWEIELPEEAIPHEVQLRESQNLLFISSCPTDVLKLPPQGWTLICSLEIFWSPTLSPPQYDDRKN